MKKLPLLFILVFTLALLSAGEHNEYYFRFPLKDQTRLAELSRIISIDAVKGHFVYAYANDSEWIAFQNSGLMAQLLPHPGINPEAKMAMSAAQMRSWDVYPSYDTYISMMYAFAQDYPNLCRIVEAGNTEEGRQILFAVISDNVNQREAEPRLMYTSTMHGDETVGYVLMLRLIDSLLNGYGSDPRLSNLVNESELWINPNANPDGTYYGGNHTVANARRYNSNGYDLNRNFPDPEGNQYSNPLQIETTHMMNLGLQQGFDLVANFHGGAEVVNYPWDHRYDLHADNTWYMSISRAYASSAQNNSPSGYMTYLNNGITNGAAWYVTTGNRQDWTNYSAWGREVTIELSTTKNPAASTLPDYWQYNYDALLGYLEQGLKGIHGVVTDAWGNPLSARITVLDHDDSLSEVFNDDESGLFYRYLSPGIYDLQFSAAGYDDIVVNDVIVDSEGFTPMEVVFGNLPDQLEISLQSGWNEISFNVLPDDPTSVIALIPNLLQIKNCSESFNPALQPQFNTLALITPESGYWVKVASSGLLQIEGSYTSQRTIELKEGWNFTGYLPESPLPVTSALSSILPYVQDVRSNDELWSRDQLLQMQPGKAYWIKVTQACSLIYPD